MTTPSGTQGQRCGPPAGPTGAARPSRGVARALTGRSGLAVAVAACVVGAALALFANAATWTRAEAYDGATASATADGVLTGVVRVELTGGDVSAGVTALALLGLAAAVAVLATRGTARRLVGLLAAAAGAGLLVLALRVVVDPAAATLGADDVAALSPSGDARLAGGASLTGAPVAAALGGLVLAAAGALTVALGRRWPGMAGRYQTRAARPVDTWDALERGDDPTA
ncbi:MAG: Trp biosynthesis-associated membrane protein [Frankia sp.]|nr:Trp biosynthesis-associated membrane protein [Frankia sp.]